MVSLITLPVFCGLYKNTCRSAFMAQISYIINFQQAGDRMELGEAHHEAVVEMILAKKETRNAVHYQVNSKAIIYLHYYITAHYIQQVLWPKLR